MPMVIKMMFITVAVIPSFRGFCWLFSKCSSVTVCEDYSGKLCDVDSGFSKQFLKCICRRHFSYAGAEICHGCF